MRQNTIRASQITQGYVQLLIKDFPADKWFTRPAGVPNHAAWQIGHVAVSANGALAVLGVPSMVDASWAALFGRGSESKDDASIYPPVSEILATYNKVYAALTEAFSNADESVLLADTKIERLIERFPKQGDFLVFLLTSHLAMHAGQFSTLRKLLGLGHVM
jgi:hypothetical protein